MPARPHSANYQLSTRDNGGGGGLSRNSIIAIAVVCGVFGLVVFRFIFKKLFARCRHSKNSVPLPPVQDLAHRREQHLAAFSERYNNSAPNSWLDVSESNTAGRALSQTGSTLSLLTTPEKNATSSVYTDDATTVESAAFASPITASDDKAGLLPPNPMFYPPPPGSSPHLSMVSSTSGSSSYSSLNSGPNTPSPPPSIPVPEDASAESTSPRLSRAQARAGPGDNIRASSRGRPQSQLSLRSSYSGHTTYSASTTRGAPHRPCSNVQIVLPAPLGVSQQQQYPNMQQWQRSSTYGRGSLTKGFADQWVVIGSQFATIPEGRRKSVSSNSNRSHHRSSSTPTGRSKHNSSPSNASAPRNAVSPPPSGPNRRSMSQHTMSSSSLRHELQQSSPPPALPTPTRTYSGLADLAESSLEISNVTKDRGRSYSMSSPQPQPQSQSGKQAPASKGRPAGSSSRPRSQSNGKKLSKQRDPVR